MVSWVTFVTLLEDRNNVFHSVGVFTDEERLGVLVLKQEILW